MKSKQVTHGDYLKFDKQYPLDLSKPLKKKPKYMNEVWVSFTAGSARKGWVLSLTGGDFSSSMQREMYGDKISIFFPPIRGDKFYRGIKTWWLTDIGIGKTLEECHESYCKHDWFKRSKSDIQHHRFWSHIETEQIQHTYERR